MRQIECASCEYEFEGKLWNNGACPKCGREYYWEEEDDEGLNFYPYVVWEE